jgi:hypothetical protein
VRLESNFQGRFFDCVDRFAINFAQDDMHIFLTTSEWSLLGAAKTKSNYPERRVVSNAMLASESDWLSVSECSMLAPPFRESV